MGQGWGGGGRYRNDVREKSGTRLEGKGGARLLPGVGQSGGVDVSRSMPKVREDATRLVRRIEQG